MQIQLFCIRGFIVISQNKSFQMLGPFVSHFYDFKLLLKKKIDFLKISNCSDPLRISDTSWTMQITGSRFFENFPAISPRSLLNESEFTNRSYNSCNVGNRTREKSQKLRERHNRRRRKKIIIIDAMVASQLDDGRPFVTWLTKRDF